MTRRRFGTIRHLPSGRWQASFIAISGRRVNAPVTFRNKTDAGRWLAIQEADLARGTWVDDQLGHQTFGDYARAHLRDSQTIGPRWRETCLRNLRIHLAPLEHVQLRALTPVAVREWYAAAMRGGGGKTSIAQSYRFMRTVMNTAVRENAVPKNPCNIPAPAPTGPKNAPSPTSTS